ncbi:MAG: phospho-sugar mutase, partial [Firmicutes bacterium]|nr:phospho-sugar mutase [Bacillota bacterium]
MQYMDSYQKWLRDFQGDPSLVRDLTAIAGDKKEIEDRFYTDLSFGTGGMRGVLGYGTNR